MKRLHVHLTVKDLPASIGFYTTLFSVAPSVVKHDYAKWMLDDPRVNFAISMRGRDPGLDHLGIQVDSSFELDEVVGRLKVTEQPIQEQRGTTCCYAQSDKAWVEDPQRVRWETFHTTGEATVYGEDLLPSACGSQTASNEVRLLPPSISRTQERGAAHAARIPVQCRHELGVHTIREHRSHSAGTVR